MCAKPVQQQEMPEYFYLRPGSRNWQVRLVAPQALAPFLDKPEYRQSTGTADRKKAKVIGAQLIADKLAEWEALEASLSLNGAVYVPTHLSASLIEEICERRLGSWLKSDEQERFEDGGFDDEEFQELSQFCELTDAAMRAVLGRGPASGHWNHVVDAVFDWCLTLGYDISSQDPLLTQLVRRFAASEKLAMEKLKGRNAGEEIVTPLAPNGVKANNGNLSQTSFALSTITALYEADKRNTVGRSALSKNVSIWNRFVDFMGDVPFDSVSSNDVYRFLKERLTSSKDPWSMGYAHGPACKALNELFSLARTLGHMNAPHPIRNLESKPTIAKEENEKRNKPRFPFTRQQINHVFQSAWFDPNASNWTGKLSVDLAGRYWPPLISQLHGLRGVEALQLIADDFDLSKSVPLVTFKIELIGSGSQDGKSEKQKVIPKRSQKNNHTRRTLPLHPKLIELGLVDYVIACKAQGENTPLFESSLPEPGGKNPKWGRAYTQSFLRFVRDTLGFGNGYGNHSWRHTFEDEMRAANVANGTWPAGVTQILSGRKMPRDADCKIFREVGSEAGYGHGYNPVVLHKYLAQLEYPEITFPPPFKEWIAIAGKVSAT